MCHGKLLDQSSCERWLSYGRLEHVEIFGVWVHTQGLTQLADLRLPTGAELLPRSLLETLPQQCACRP